MANLRFMCARLSACPFLGHCSQGCKTRERAFYRGMRRKDDLQRAWDDPQRPSLRLCDFGAARKLEDVSGKSCLDLTYYIGRIEVVPRTREMRWRPRRNGVAVDVWGAACITAEASHGRTPVSRGRRACGVTTGVEGPRTVSRASRSVLDGVGRARRCLDAGPAPGLKASRRGRLGEGLSESVVDVLKDMLHCDSNLRPSASECVIRLQAAMRPATAKIEEAPLKCWSECERLKQTWEPVVQAGATAFKTSANQPHRAVPDAQQLRGGGRCLGRGRI